MSLGRKKRGWTSGDPVGSEKPRGKASSRQMGRYDGSFTATERRKKNELMRQFMQRAEGGGAGNSEAYRGAACWDKNGRLKP